MLAKLVRAIIVAQFYPWPALPDELSHCHYFTEFHFPLVELAQLNPEA